MLITDTHEGNRPPTAALSSRWTGSGHLVSSWHQPCVCTSRTYICSVSSTRCPANLALPEPAWTRVIRPTRSRTAVLLVRFGQQVARAYGARRPRQERWRKTVKGNGTRTERVQASLERHGCVHYAHETCHGACTQRHEVGRQDTNIGTVSTTNKGRTPSQLCSPSDRSESLPRSLRTLHSVAEFLCSTHAQAAHQ